jgi:hypothetical protein
MVGDTIAGTRVGVRHTRRRYAATLAALIAASAMVAGCTTSTAGPGVTTTATSGSSTATTTPTATATSTPSATTAPTAAYPADVPAEARANTPAGAIAFAKHFFGQVNKAYTTPQAGLIAPLSPWRWEGLKRESVRDADGVPGPHRLRIQHRRQPRPRRLPTSRRQLPNQHRHHRHRLPLRNLRPPPRQHRTWRYLGSTCFADQVPGATPTVSLAQIINAFHLTPWATATVSTQPEGNTTLVGLPTYARITWSTSGYEPGEIDTLDPATMLGLTVQIRPRVDHYTYVFGDGTTFGPTHSDGGVWPTGDVTHAYPTPGAYQARVDTTFTGDFRINGGPWTQIPDTVTVTGPTTTITVHTAKPVLVH